MINRRDFVKVSSIGAAGWLAGRSPLPAAGYLVYGQQEKRYRLDRDWVKARPQDLPVNDCHEMVQDADGHIVLLTNETRNNVIFFDKSGRLSHAWGHEFPGAHGLTIAGHGKEQFLFLTDTERNQFFQTTLDGRIVKTWDYPADAPGYESKKQFVPTETAVLPNGECYVADGYGAQFILHYDAQGHLKNVFGGRGPEPRHLDNAHGICVDTRRDTPELIVTDRTRCCFKRFSLDGTFLGTIDLPGACVCRPVIQGDYLYTAVLRSPDLGHDNSGFVLILNKDNQVVSAICGTPPTTGPDGRTAPFRQTIPLFQHPHDVMVDEDDNLYVCQWNSGKVYPFRFIPEP